MGAAAYVCYSYKICLAAATTRRGDCLITPGQNRERGGGFLSDGDKVLLKDVAEKD